MSAKTDKNETCARLLLLLCICLAAATSAFSADFSFSGALSTDDDHKSFFFTLTQQQNVVLKTVSYAAGGLDPTLSVFDAAGNLIANNQDGTCGLVAADPATGFCWDSYLSITLPPGTYQLVLTQSDNAPVGPALQDGFVYDGQANFAGGFQDDSGNRRSAAFGLSVQSVVSAQAQLVISQQPPPSGTVETNYSYQFTATGGTSPYKWTLYAGALPGGLTLSAAGVLSGTPTAAGTFDFTLQSTDSAAQPMTGTQAFRITIATQALQISTTTLPSGAVNAPYTQTLALGGGSPPYTWAFSGTLTNIGGVTLSTAGVLSGTPTFAGNFTLPVQVTDGKSTIAQKQLSWQVNAGLTITSSATIPAGITATAYAGFTFTAGGGAGNTYRWSVASGSALPGGMNLTASGLLQGTPAAKGVYTFRVQVTDGVQPALQTVSFGVYDPISITTTALPGGASGQAYGPATVTATGGSGAYAWSATGLPGGLSMSAAGVIGGTAGTGGAFSALVRLTDATAGQTAQTTLTISIGFPALQLTSAGGTLGVAVGANVTRFYSATGGRQPYVWSLNGAPAWLSIDASGNLNGVASQPGLFNFTVIVTDAQGASNSAAVTVSVLGISTTSLPGGSTTAAYSAGFAAAGGTPPYSWSATGVPSGLALSGGGVLSGTPRTGGSFNIAVTVTDGGGLSVTLPFTLVVTAPTLLTVSQGALASGTVGVAYADSLSVSGGTGPYSWSIVGGSLPPGLSAGATGAITGVPGAIGTYSFTAQATDGRNATATGGLSITINPSPLTLTSSSLPGGIVGSEYPAQVLTPAGGTAPYVFALATGSLPPGLTLVGGQLSGTPTSAGTFGFSVTVTDSGVPAAKLTIALSVTIRPAQADLILSGSAVSFSLTAPATVLPATSAVTVRSSVVLQLLNYTVAVTPAAAWVTVSGAGTGTPGSLTIGLTSAALALPASATPYQTSVAVTCVAPSPCAGSTQNISVSLSVTSPPPMLSVATSLLSFSASPANPSPAPQTLTLQNTGGGSLGIRSVSSGSSWLSLSGVPGSVAAGASANITVSATSSALPPGYYNSSISVVSSAGAATVPVSFLVSARPTMSLSPSGTQYQSQTGSSPGNPNGSFAISETGAGSINWTASVTSGSNWLKLISSSGSAAAGSPATVGFVLDSAALDARTYYGSILVSSPDVENSPQEFRVVLTATATNAPVAPDPQPAGLVFLTSAEATAVTSQTVQVFASSAAALGYQASASTTSGGAWLTVTPATGSTSAALPAQTKIVVNPGTLAPGDYRGAISYALSGAAVRTVNVTMNVAPSAAPAGSAIPASFQPNATTCAANALVPTQTGLVTNFAQPTAWPVPLSIRVVDNCGSAVTGGQVVATFSNGDSPISLRSADPASGVYSATWTPRAAAAQVTITARATAGGLPAATTQISGQVKPNAAPVLSPNASLHVFAPLVGGALGPGNIIQIYGQNLSAQATGASAIPLPTNLGGTQVVIGGILSPVYYASPTQVNAQIPFELAPNETYQIVVQANGALTSPESIRLSAAAPGIAAFANGQVLAQHPDASLISDTAPAKPGEIIVFYLSGLGATDIPVASGAAAPLDQLVRPVDTPVLKVNGAEVPVLFAGLTPGLVGLYQVNFKVPDTAPDGALPLLVVQSGVVSNSTLLPVKK